MRFAWRMTWDVLPIPAGATATLPDGTKVEGPVVLEGPPRWEKVEEDD